ncbi:unnamed protein product [Polarella glacialis]|uniref:Uncharacterized protein n=1 Tax=Polarella glacialis TaxID=89957 RepID=A0A813JRY1_POLGL|nr:unnamed protein product [Polarella glacialis]
MAATLWFVFFLYLFDRWLVDFHAFGVAYWVLLDMGAAAYCTFSVRFYCFFHVFLYVFFGGFLLLLEKDTLSLPMNSLFVTACWVFFCPTFMVISSLFALTMLCVFLRGHAAPRQQVRLHVAVVVWLFGCCCCCCRRGFVLN